MALPLGGAAAAFLTAALASFVPSAAAAQTAPGLSPAPSLPAGPRSLWRLALSADATWYENARLVGGPLGSSTWNTGGSAGLDYSRRLSSGTFGIGARGGALYYPDLEDLNQPTWGGNLSLNVAPNRGRTQLRLDQAYSRTNTRQLVFDPAALPLPTSTLDYSTTTLGLTQRLSRSWQLGLDGAFNVRRYADERFVDGEEVVASMHLGRQVGQHSTVYLAYGFLNSWYSALSTRTHQAFLGARRQPKRGVGFDMAAGVAYLETTGQFYPAGNASLEARGRRAAFTLAYRRDFGQGFGYGRQMIGDLGSATLAWTMATRFVFSADYAYGYRRDPSQTDYKVRTQVASSGLAWGITKDLGLSARYAWEHNETEGAALLEGGRVLASISYGVEWR